VAIELQLNKNKYNINIDNMLKDKNDYLKNIKDGLGPIAYL
jgi:hypothetical protein